MKYSAPLSHRSVSFREGEGKEGKGRYDVVCQSNQLR